MPRLVFQDDAGRSQSISLKKKLVTLGRAPENDVVLKDLSVARVHAHILSDASGFVLNSMDPKGVLLVNGRPRRSSPLRPDDVIQLGNVSVTFQMDDVSSGSASPPGPAAGLAQRAGTAGASAAEGRLTGSPVGPAGTSPPASSRARTVQSPAQLFSRLLQFSERVMADLTSRELFRALLDQLVEVTRADRGFLVLVQEGQLRVAVARNMGGSDLERPEALISDSIVHQVVESGEPLIVSDAIHDARFGTAQSVVDLKLSSVMCVPLKFRTELLGVLYLGNDRVAGLFSHEDMETLRIFAGQAAILLKNALLVNELQGDNESLREELKAASFGRIIGQCDGIREVSRTIGKVANTDISILVLGETGTGKELIARELHARSSRGDKPFISINCGAIPENLLESELFGHIKGAFTGAIANRVGKFEAAEGGTIFLDEIGEMPPSLQVKLLRVLQERLIDKVGESQPLPVDIRVISATHKDLETAITDGRFREDLYYRLNEIQIRVPPLRERGEDVLLLSRYLLDKFLERYPNRKLKGFSKEALVAIQKYYWPGNVRQLENKIKKAVIMAEGSEILPEDLEIKLEADQLRILPLAQAQADFTMTYIRQVLEINDWNKTKTARDLDVDPRTIFRYLEKIDT